MNKLLPTMLIAGSLLSACGGGGAGSGGSAPQLPTTPEVDEQLPQPSDENVEHLSGGSSSVNDQSADAFSLKSANMSDIGRIRQFNLGNDFFQNPWVAGSASTSSRDGLGGHFNNNACQDCHIRDGRGHADDIAIGAGIGSDFNSLLIRASRSNPSAADLDTMALNHGANVADSSVGGQLQHKAVAGVTAEAVQGVSYTEQLISFADGETVSLRKPSWHLASSYAGSGFDFDIDTIFSARVAQPMIGLGLLALISEADIVAMEDVDDSNNDGISGRANRVWSIEQNATVLGRFGWKAGQASVIEQSAGAFLGDMGLTSRLHRQENCLPHQADCITSPNGNGDSVNNYDYEVSDTVLAAVGHYSSHLAVPQRRNAYDEQVQRGKALFNEAGCSSCHSASYTTAADRRQPELSQQLIFPYTDMLLHDMGEDLADFGIDNRQDIAEVAVEFLASNREWRTPPLWGIGLTHTVDPKASFLHDGRARTIMEAVLWHGGEAAVAQQAVLSFDAQQREALLAFLNDL